MGREASPAFQFYVKEWRSSRKVSRMTFAQRGMYLEMLLEQWESGALPDNYAEVQHILGGRPSYWRSSWTLLRSNFEVVKPGFIQNARLESERVKQRKWRKRAQNGGIARAKKQTSTAKTPSKQDTSSASDVHSVSDRVCVSDRVSVFDRKPSDHAFDTFWQRYPNKAGKQAAKKAWAKLTPDPETIGAIDRALEWQTAQPKWTKDGGQYVPHASTWLNGRRWEDELEATRPKVGTPEYYARLDRDS